MTPVDLDLLTLIGRTALRGKIGPDEAESEGCGRSPIASSLVAKIRSVFVSPRLSHSANGIPPSGMAKGIGTLNKIQVPLLPSR